MKYSQTIGKLFQFLCITFIMYTCYATPITYVINSPGYYTIGTNIIANATDPNDVVIRIDTSNVILDMSGHVITQDPLSTATGLCGIEVSAGMHDVRIINIAITDISGTGIRILNGCEDIEIGNVFLSNCQKAGMYFAGTVSDVIQRLLVYDCYITTCGILNANNGAAFVGEYLQDFAFYNCGCLQNGDISINTVYVCYLNNAKSGRYMDCLVNNNRAQLNISPFYAENSSHIIYKGCRIIWNINDDVGASVVAGIDWFNCDNMLCESCNIASNQNIASLCVGVYAHDGGSNNAVLKTSVYNNNGENCAGIQFENQTNGVIESNECRFNNGTAGNGYGICLANTTGNDNCFVRGNLVMANTGTTTGYGIIDEATLSSTCIVQNSAFNNATNYSVTYAIGVTIPVINGSLSNALTGMPSTVSGTLSNFSVQP